MKHPITICWLGTRKDAGRGSVWAWFVLNGRSQVPIRRSYYGAPLEDQENTCYTLSVKIGKSVVIEKRELTVEFLAEIQSKKQNYRQVWAAEDQEKVTNRWGKAVDDEIGAQILFEMLKG